MPVDRALRGGDDLPGRCGRRRRRTPAGARRRRPRRPAGRRTAAPARAAVRERAAVDRDDRRVVGRRGDREPADVRVVGVQRRRLLAALPRRAPSIAAWAALACTRAAASTREASLSSIDGTPNAFAAGMPRCALGPAVEELEASGRACAWPTRRCGASSGQHRDPQQRRLREPELLALVPALEAEPGVPVQVAGVRPVAAQHALAPGADDLRAAGVQRRHPARRAPAGRRRGSRRRCSRTRRCRGCTCGARAPAAGSGSGSRRRGCAIVAPAIGLRAPSTKRRNCLQQLRRAGPGRVAADRRGRGVHPRVPVDLVQPQRRPAPELRRRRCG